MGKRPEASTVETFAAEHALGVLSGPARAVAEVRMFCDVSFARRVARWRAHLAALFDPIEPAAASPALWKRIETAVSASDGAGIRRRAGVLGLLLLAGSSVLLARTVRRRWRHDGGGENDR